MRWLLYLTNFCTITFSFPPIDRKVAEMTDRSTNSRESVDRRDHLEGVPLERDGQLNKDFRKEILFGNLKPRDSLETKKAIRELFFQSDLDKNDFLSEDELEKAIHKNAILHIEESKKETENLFKETDLNQDRQITWQEYNQRFLVEKSQEIDLKESFEAVADKKTLNITEFTAFLHPELSKSTIQELAEELLKSYDKDENGMISRDEFVEFSDAEFDGLFAEEEKKEQEARGVEFDRDLDENGDGFATLEELIAFVDPQGEGRHKREVAELIWQVDTDEDGKLSLEEMLEQNLLLERSSLFEAGRKLHEDL